MNEMIQEQVENFWYWVRERHLIYNKRRDEEPWPWTDDPILQEYKFTNPFRQYDAVTKHLREWLEQYNDEGCRQVTLLQAIIIFRMFNWPPTYRRLVGTKATVFQPEGMYWDEEAAKKTLHEKAKAHNKVFTGAYIITNQGSKRPKIDLVCEAITHGISYSKLYLEKIRAGNSVQNAVTVLRDIPLVGGFVAYELACDLMHHTPILAQAMDRNHWANPGPGAQRGLARIFNRPLTKKVNERQANKEMRQLLYMTDEELWPTFVDDKGKERVLFDYIERHNMADMRMIEHSLCEFDKYMRVKNGEGQPRSKFVPPSKRKLATI